MLNKLVFVLVLIFIHDGDGFRNHLPASSMIVTDKKSAENAESISSVTIAGDANPGPDDDTCNITTIISKSSGRIQSPNYPRPYPSNCEWTYIIHVGASHKVKVDVHNLDLDNEDALIIMPKSNSDSNGRGDPSESTNSSNTFEVDAECCESVLIRFTVGNHSNNHSGFSLTYERNEYIDPKPTEQSRMSGWYQIYLSGLTVHQFYSIKEFFRRSLANMAKEYYEKMKSKPENSTILTDVVINNAMHCPISWPWSSNCVQVNFSVNVGNDSTEFSSEHIITLWNSYRATNELSKLGIWEYEIPNIEWLFWFWIALLSSLTLLFCLLLLIIVKTKLIYFYFKRLKVPVFTDEMRTNIQSWRNQSSFVYHAFNAENSHRFRFLKEYERTSGPSSININQYQFTHSNGEVTNPEDLVPDFDSDEDQHIYNSLTYK